MLTKNSIPLELSLVPGMGFMVQEAGLQTSVQFQIRDANQEYLLGCVIPKLTGLGCERGVGHCWNIIPASHKDIHNTA